MSDGPPPRAGFWGQETRKNLVRRFGPFLLAPVNDSVAVLRKDPPLFHKILDGCMVSGQVGFAIGVPLGDGFARVTRRLAFCGCLRKWQI